MQQMKYRKISELIKNPENPKYITKEEFKQLCTSIKNNPDYFEARPLILSNRTGKLVIIGGNQRYEAAIKIGLKKVPTFLLENLTEKREREITIRDNIENGKWDYDKLANEWDIDELQDWGMEIESLDEPLVNKEDIEDNYNIIEKAEQIKNPITEFGDIWELGKHRLMCGDSIKSDDIKILMDGEKADMVFTDPPYNVNYKGTKKQGILNDNMSEEEFVEFTLGFTKAMKENLKEGGVFYMCSGWSSYPIFVYAIKVEGMNFANPIVWVKNNTSMGWNDYRYKYEIVIKAKKKKETKKKSTPILYGWNGGKHYFKDTRFESDVWEIKRRASNTMVHPTQKPIALINKAISNSSKPNDIVLDIFGGSGGTLISSERLNRRCRIMELDPIYCDVIINRWEEYTNKKAVKFEG